MATRKNRTNKQFRSRTTALDPQRLLHSVYRLRSWLVLAAFVVLVSFWSYVTSFTIRQYSDHWSFPPVRVLLSAPQYFSANEDEDVRFAVENEDVHQTDVAFRLMNNGPLAFFTPEGTYSGTVQGRWRIDQQFKVLFPWDISQVGHTLGQSAGLSLSGSVSGTPVQPIDLPLVIAPIPWAKALRLALGVPLLSVSGMLGKKVFDQAKKSGKKTK